MANTATAMRATHDPIRTIPFFLIGADWSEADAALAHPARLVVIQNWTDEDVMLSTRWTDLAVDPDYGEIAVRSGSGRVLDITSNNFSTQTGGIFVYPAGTQFWIRFISNQPTIDNVYIEVIYGEDLL
jgi:hypothetical protein